jgi:pimeloyl-ACP methyl ester carboxylesterase
MADSRQKTVATLHSEGISVLCEGISTLLSSTSRSQHPEFISELRAQIKDDDAAGFAEITRGLAMRKDRQELLAQICVPTLVLCGEEDTVSPPNGMRDMAERIPRATFHLIPAAGHLSPWEQPETFNNAIRAFWAKL